MLLRHKAAANRSILVVCSCRQPIKQRMSLRGCGAFAGIVRGSTGSDTCARSGFHYHTDRVGVVVMEKTGRCQQQRRHVGLGAAFATAIAADGAAVVVNLTMPIGPFRRRRRRTPSPPAAASRSPTPIRSDAPDNPAKIIADRHLGLARRCCWSRTAASTATAVRIGDGDTGLAQVMAINFFANACWSRPPAALRRCPPGSCSSSTGELHGVRGRSAYAASKGALNGYALSLADELKRTPIPRQRDRPLCADQHDPHKPGREADRPRMGR